MGYFKLLASLMLLGTPHSMLLAGCGAKLGARLGADLEALQHAEAITFKRPDNDYDGEHIFLLPDAKRQEAIALLTELNTIAAKLVLLSDTKKNPPSSARDEEIRTLSNTYDEKMFIINELMPTIGQYKDIIFDYEKWDSVLRKSKIESLKKNNLLEADKLESARRELEEHLKAIYGKISFLRVGDPLIIVGNSGSRREGIFLGIDKKTNNILFDWRRAVHHYPLNRLNVEATVEATRKAKAGSP